LRSVESTGPAFRPIEHEAGTTRLSFRSLLGLVLVVPAGNRGAAVVST
jgi:hypothetical protein